MATFPTPDPGAVVLDANIAIALSAHEPGRDFIVSAELVHYAHLG